MSEVPQTRPLESYSVKEFLEVTRLWEEQDMKDRACDLLDQLEGLAAQNPEKARAMLEALAGDAHLESRRSAAIYSTKLLDTDREGTLALLRQLIQDHDRPIRFEAYETVRYLAADDRISSQEFAELVAAWHEAQRGEG